MAKEEFTEEQAAAKLQELGFTVHKVNPNLPFPCCSSQATRAQLEVRRVHTKTCAGMLVHQAAGWPEGQFTNSNHRGEFVVIYPLWKKAWEKSTGTTLSEHTNAVEALVAQWPKEDQPSG